VLGTWHRETLAGLLHLSYPYHQQIYGTNQITALALMGTRMNAAFIFNIVHALKTDTWTDTDARYFFPFVVLLTLAGEWACLLGWWGRWAPAALRPLLSFATSHHRRLTPGLRRALHRLRKAVNPGEHNDECPAPGSAATIATTRITRAAAGPRQAAGAAAQSPPPPSSQLRGSRLALAFLFFWGFKHRFPFFPKRASYSPVANAFFATVRYVARDEFRRAQATQKRPHPQQQQRQQQKQPSKPYYERVELPPLAATRKSNVVFILNDSLGNRILKNEKGLDAYPFYRDRVQSGTDPAFFDFANNRACSGNTNSAAPAALTGTVRVVLGGGGGGGELLCLR
jgi:hypothetical protein